MQARQVCLKKHYTEIVLIHVPSCFLLRSVSTYEEKKTDQNITEGEEYFIRMFNISHNGMNLQEDFKKVRGEWVGWL